MQQVLMAIIAVFIGLFVAGLVVYIVFFAVNKTYFRKEINLMKRFNKNVDELSAINLYKIKVLADNKIDTNIDYNAFKAKYDKLVANKKAIQTSIEVLHSFLEHFNLKVCKNSIVKIEKDLTDFEKDLAAFKKRYEKYTQYPDTVAFMLQAYFELFEKLESFYNNSIKNNYQFKQINSLIDIISKAFVDISKQSGKFDYRKTVNVLLNVKSKIRVLTEIILKVLRFQIVDEYLSNTITKDELMVSKAYAEIARSDLQTLTNLMTAFKQNYKQFNKAFYSLDLKKAHDFALTAISAIQQINHFCYIHVSTPKLISLSLTDIKQQSDNILVNKEDILNSVKDLKKYFVLEPEILSNFDIIEDNVNAIAKYNVKAQHVNYRNHVEKLGAIQTLCDIGTQIKESKQKVNVCIDNINGYLSNVITLVRDLNDLYVYYWQLLAAIKTYAPNNSQTSDMEYIIRNNLFLLDKYATQLIDKSAKPNFDQINKGLNIIIEQVRQLFNKLTSSVMLKTYATKLMVYADRYKTSKASADEFKQANREFNNKNYEKCIDLLLNICKKNKKNLKS